MVFQLFKAGIGKPITGSLDVMASGSFARLPKVCSEGRTTVECEIVTATPTVLSVFPQVDQVPHGKVSSALDSVPHWFTRYRDHGINL